MPMVHVDTRHGTLDLYDTQGYVVLAAGPAMVLLEARDARQLADALHDQAHLLEAAEHGRLPGQEATG